MSRVWLTSISSSCRSTASLVGLLDSEYKAERDLILMGIDGLWAVFELKSMSLKNDFCRLFVNHGVLPRLTVRTLYCMFS